MSTALLAAAAVHHVLAWHAAVLGYYPASFGGCNNTNPLNPCASAPAPMVPVVSTFLGWTHWFAIGSGVFGFFWCGVSMTLGRRNRSNLAAEGAAGIPWVLGGLSVCAVAYGVTTLVLS